MNFIISLIAAIGVMSLLVYVLITFLDLINRRDLIQKCYKILFPKMKYKEVMVFTFLRPMFLVFSEIAIVPIAIMEKGPIVFLYHVLIFLAMLLAFGHLIKHWND